MKHPWCTTIIPQQEQEEISRCMSRISLTLLMMAATVQHAPQYLDKKLSAAS